MLHYADEIVAERAKHRVNQSAVAKRAKIFRSTLIDIENKRVGLDKETFEKIIRAIKQEDHSTCPA